jgi:undecaprenyl pyrophosphate phosphatase UppP
MQIGALVAHIILFWGGDVMKAFKAAKAKKFDDPHHAHIAKHYKEAPWWWYIIVLVVSFVLGLVVVIKEKVTLPAWAYVVALVIGTIISPFVSLWNEPFQRHNF